MNIKLGENYIIKSDSLNYILYKRHLSDPTHRFSKGEVKETWEPVGYFNKFEQLVNYVIEREIKESDSLTLTMIIRQIKGVGDTLVQLLEEIADGKEN